MKEFRSMIPFPDGDAGPSIEYTSRRWQDHVTEFDDRYKETQNSDGTVTHQPVEGEVIQQGTPQNAKNFNDLEEKAWAAEQLAAELARVVNSHRLTLGRLVSERGSLTLTNSLGYPFNNSKKTVVLSSPKDTVDYIVNVDAAAVGGGGVGEVVVTDKQVNGFKVEYTGGATRVDLKYTVDGGMN